MGPVNRGEAFAPSVSSVPRTLSRAHMAYENKVAARREGMFRPLAKGRRASLWSGESLANMPLAL